MDSRNHYQAYIELRDAVLTRHFAMRRHWRADLLSTNTELADQTAATQGRRDARLLARWTKNPNKPDHGENPLMIGSQLVAFLAVEASFGNTEAIDVLLGYLSTLDSLFPYSDVGFEGCPVRWDAYTSDDWDLDANGKPVACREFLLRGDGTHWPMVPEGALNSYKLWPTSTQAEVDERAKFLRRYRRSEPSMDEMTGLVASYALILDLLPESSDVWTQAKDQLLRVAAYLERNGYHLVRPPGGFSARGAGGLLPSFEAPWARMIYRTTGVAHWSRVEFPGALRQAGVWEAMAGPYGWGGVLGVGAAILLFGLHGPAWAWLGLTIKHATELDVITGVELGRAWQISQHHDVFDVWDFTHRDVELAIPLECMPYKHRLDAINRDISRRSAQTAENVRDGLKLSLKKLAELETSQQVLLTRKRAAQKEFEDCLSAHASDTTMERNFFSADARLEFAGSFLLGKMPREKRWELGMLTSSLVTDGPAKGFGPYLALTALRDEEDPLDTKGKYQTWFNLRTRIEAEHELVDKDAGTAFAVAVAVVLGGRQHEPELVRRLNAAYDSLLCKEGDDEWHDLYVDAGVEKSFTPSSDTVHSAIDYLSALALAWRHAKVQEESGNPVSSDFPFPPDLSSIPKAKVPEGVLAKLNDGTLTGWPLDAMATPDGALFAPEAPRKPRAPRVLAADYKVSRGASDPGFTKSSPDVRTQACTKLEDEVKRLNRALMAMSKESAAQIRDGNKQSVGRLFHAEREALEKQRAAAQKALVDCLSHNAGQYIVRTVPVTVSEAHPDEVTGLLVPTGAWLQFSGEGTVSSGVWLTWENGPNGWDRTETSAAFPLHGTPLAHPFSLLGRLGGYFFIGDGSALGTVQWLGPTRRLFLRINDDAPANGSGFFNCLVTLITRAS